MEKNTVKLKSIFAKNKNKIFIIDAMADKEFTYADIEKLSLRLASLLSRKFKIKKHDKVIVLLPNSIEFVLFYFACVHIGATIVPLNPRLTADEINWILENSGARMLCASNNLNKSLRFSDKNNVPRAFLFDLDQDKIESDNKSKLLDAISSEPYFKSSFQGLSGDDIFAISYTSGTTAHPKGVMVYYKSVINHAFLFIKVMGIDCRNRFYSIFPLSYMGGWYNLLFIPLIGEGSVVLDEAFGAKSSFNFWEKPIKHKANTFWFVPSMMSILLLMDRGKKGENYCKKKIKLALVGTEPLIISLKREFEKKYGIELYENYGLSETFIISTNSSNFPANEGVGSVLPGCEVIIVDENGRDLGIGKEGNILIKSPFLMAGYFKDVRQTKEVVKAKLVYSGDIGYFNKRGTLFITGRKKDLIKRGGILISPSEIENVIKSYPAVAEVAVLGIPDKISGEKIVAAIKLKSQKEISQEKILKYCSQHLASFKIPEEILFMEDFPRGSTGKILKRQLKENIISKF